MSRPIKNIINKTKEFVLLVGDLYGSNGWTFSAEMFEKVEEQTNIIFKVSLNYNQNSRSQKNHDQIDRELSEDPTKAVSTIPGGCAVPYHRINHKTKEKTYGYLKVIFSGFLLQTLDQEACIRIVEYIMQLITASGKDTFSFYDYKLCQNYFCAYILFKLRSYEEYQKNNLRYPSD